MLRHLNKYKKDFLKYYKQGMSDSQIASVMLVSRHYIGKIRRSLKLPVNRDSHRLYKKKFKQLISKGYLDLEISKKLGISRRTVAYLRNKWNVKSNYVKRSYNNNTDRRKGYMLRNIKHSAFTQGLDFDLDYKDLELPKYCPILGVKLIYGKGINHPNNATVDKIVPSKGYIKGNIIIISRLANVMKNNASLKELKLFCNNMKKLIKYYEIEGALGSITDVFPDIEFYKET